MSFEEERRDGPTKHPDRAGGRRRGRVLIPRRPTGAPTSVDAEAHPERPIGANVCTTPFPDGADGRRWILQPLIDAGLRPREIEALMYRVAFEAITRGPGFDANVPDMVADRAAPVRVAWLETITRMIALPGPKQ